MFRTNNGYIENNLYKKYDNRAFNATGNITKPINKYSNGITDKYKVNKISNVKNVL